MNIIYRKATAEDLDAIVSFVKEAIDNMNNNQIYQWDDIYPTWEDFKSDLDDDALYVGYMNDIPAVTFTLNQESDEEYKSAEWVYPEKSYKVIHRLCVNPECQNMGVGFTTMNYIQDLLKSEGIEAIRLDVFSQNPYSLKLYDKLDFKQTGSANWRKGLFYLMEKYL